MDFDDERIKLITNMPELFDKVDKDRAILIDNLKQAVAIPSISNDPDHHEDILKMLKFCTKKLEHLGASVDLIDGNNENSTNLPPVLFANLLIEDEYDTICVYGNIDTLRPENVQNNNSFNLKEENERLYGCGIRDNKTSLMCWLNALSIFSITKNKLPMNIKFVIEGTSKSYSHSLHNAIVKSKEFFKNIDYICFNIDKNDSHTPCLKYGYRGLCHFTLNISCGENKVHSGTYGGTFNQPLLDAVHIIGTITNSHGKCTIPGFLEDVRPITAMDGKRYDKIVSIESLKQNIGVKYLHHKDKESRIFRHKSNLPSITINSFNINSSDTDKEDYASIPNKITANFSIRLVVNQTTDKIFNLLNHHINKQWNLLQSGNNYEFYMNLSYKPWQEDPSSNHYKAAAAAIETVYNVSPNYNCEGYTMPVVSIFSKKCPASSIVVMPIIDQNSQDHSNTESISIESYIKGTKLIIAYLYEIHELNYV